MGRHPIALSPASHPTRVRELKQAPDHKRAVGECAMHELREFRCKDCTRVMRLPASILEQKSPHQARLSTGEMCTGIVCPECKHAFGYKAEEILPVLSDSPNPYRDPTGTSWISVDVLCVDRNCITHVQLLTAAKPTQHSNQPAYFSGLTGEAQGWQPHDLQCARGHSISSPPQLASMS